MGLELLRARAGLTRRELAERAGLHCVKIHQLEKGVINLENITLRTALKLASALGCTPDRLLDDGPREED